MPIATAIGAIGSALGITASGVTAAAGIAGAAAAGVGTVKQAEAQKKASRISAEAESVRKQQMQLEAQRKQREIFRNAMRARAVTESNQKAAGVSSESSAFGGALGQIAGAEGQQSLALAQNTALGNQLFGLNAQLAQAQGSAATWAGVSNFGKDLWSSAEMIGRIGSTITNQGPNTRSTYPKQTTS